MADEQAIQELLVQLVANIDNLTTGLDQAMDKLDQYGKKSDDTQEKSKNSFQLVDAAIGAGVAKLDEWIVQSTIAASNTESFGAVLKSLAANAGVSQQTIDDQVKSMVRLGYTTAESQKVMAVFVQEHMELSKASELAQVALDYSARAGMGLNETLDLLNETVETGNARTLRQFGITASVAGIFDAYAKNIGKTTAELTDNERRQATLQAILEHGKDIAGAYNAVTEEAGDKSEILKSRWEESKQELTSGFVPALHAVVDAALSVVNGFHNSGEAAKGLTAELVGTAAIVGTLVTTLGLIVKLWPIVVTGLTAMSGAFATLGVSLPVVIALSAAVVGLSLAFDHFEKKVDEANEKATQSLRDTRDAALMTSAQIEKLAKIDPSGAEEVLVKQRDALAHILATNKDITEYARESLTTQIAKLNSIEAEYHLRLNNAAVHKLTKKEIEDEIKAEQQLIDVTVDGYKETGADAIQVYNDFKKFSAERHADQYQAQVDEKELQKLKHAAAMEELKNQQEAAQELAKDMAVEFSHGLASQVSLFGQHTETLDEMFKRMIDKMVQQLLESGILDILSFFITGTPGGLSGGKTGVAGAVFGFDDPVNDAMAKSAGESKWFNDFAQHFSDGYVNSAIQTAPSIPMPAPAAAQGGGEVHVHFHSLTTPSPAQGRKLAFMVGDELKKAGVI